MEKCKKDGDTVFESISDFFMAHCDCSKSPCGYYKWKCASEKCKNCKSGLPVNVSCQNSQEQVKIQQFESKEREYEKLNKKLKLHVANNSIYNLNTYSYANFKM